MNKKIKILFCAEDYGSLEQNIFLIKILDKKKLLDKKNSLLICSQFFKKNIKNINLEKKFFKNNFSRILKKNILKFIMANKIDLAIVGMSTKPFSIDYQITKEMNLRNITTLSIQDFWGYTGNFDKKVFPKYIFVADEYAKELTKKKINSKILVSGLPKYIDKRPIINFSKKSKKISLLIIGQPSFIPGIEIYLKFLNKLTFFELVEIFYLPHPLEDKKKIVFDNKKIKILNKNSLPKNLSTNIIIISAFSTLSYDLLFSSIFSNKRINYKIIFLSFKPKINNYIKKIVGRSKLPLTNFANIFQLSNYNNSVIKIKEILNKKNKQCSLTKKYFIKKHNNNIFLNKISRVIRSYK